MLRYFFPLLTSMFFVFVSCTSSQSQDAKVLLKAEAFAQKLNETPNSIVLDVRTPDEYSKGHIANAINVNWFDDHFKQKVSTMDTSKPIFVYCLSGGRSAKAASVLHQKGFKHIYELDGGIMKWRGANLPLTGESASEGMSMAQFQGLLSSDKLVLIDFYADWCMPCRKMKPYLEEISRDMADKVQVVRINADDNQQICRALKVDALPVLHLYKAGKLIWSNSGYIDKNSVVEQLQ